MSAVLRFGCWTNGLKITVVMWLTFCLNAASIDISYVPNVPWAFKLAISNASLICSITSAAFVGASFLALRLSRRPFIFGSREVRVALPFGLVWVFLEFGRSLLPEHVLH